MRKPTKAALVQRVCAREDEDYLKEQTPAPYCLSVSFLLAICKTVDIIAERKTEISYFENLKHMFGVRCAAIRLQKALGCGHVVKKNFITRFFKRMPELVKFSLKEYSRPHKKGHDDRRLGR